MGRTPGTGGNMSGVRPIPDSATETAYQGSASIPQNPSNSSALRSYLTVCLPNERVCFSGSRRTASRRIRAHRECWEFFVDRELKKSGYHHILMLRW